MRVLAVVGARPQFIKAAEFARACSNAAVEHVLVHTGQHYDDEMSRLFFDDLDIPAPTVNLGVGSGSHADQTAEMMRRLDDFLDEWGQIPDWVVVFGDTNSTLAAALVAVKRQLPVAHVEAGLRSYDRRMAEEISRVLTDRIATLLFCPTQRAIDNLAAEGIREGVCLTGDVMYDSLNRYKDLAVQRYKHPLDGQPFHLATVHRAENTDDPERLKEVLACLSASSLPVLWPIHPRTKERLARFRLAIPETVTSISPVGYLEMLAHLQYCDRVVTDSGGLQKEAFWLAKPCITLRSATEWPETLEGGWNVLVDVDVARFREAALSQPSSGHAPTFGIGPGSPKMIEMLSAFAG